VIQYGNQGYPSLAIEIARVYTGTSHEAMGLKDGMLQMGVWDIPVSPSGEVLLDWPAAGERAFPQYSFLDVVRGDVPAAAFRGKAVLIAGIADGLDDRNFPFADEAPGVLAYAIFLDNLFRFEFLRAPLWVWLVEWGLFLAVCGLNIWLLPRLSTHVLLAGVPLMALLVLGGTAFMYVQKGIWIKTFYTALAIVMPLAFVVTQRLMLSEKETRDVGAEKVENQRLLGLAFQEKGMLDMAFAQFNKLPLSDEMKSIYLNLGLDYENRGLLQKAFIVYKKICDADPGFGDVFQRLERLSQTGASTSFFPVTASPVAASPLAHLSPTALDSASSDEVLTQLSRAGGVTPPTDIAAVPKTTQSVPTGSGAPTSSIAPTSLPAPMVPVGPAPRLGRYVIERHLGRGGMGDVYLVHDTVIDRRAALKTVRLDADLDPTQAIEVRQRLYREAKTVGRLTHPNIVTIHDVGEDLGVSYIVMEYVPGATLTAWMKKQPFTIGQIKHVICSAALGLQHAHEHGIFHRDVKPDNIMLSESGTVKVMDFGIARAVHSTLTKTGSVMGTPAYMSPEQASGYKIDARSDIFSLGVILYELLTGRRPFSGDTFLSLMFAIIKEEPTPPSGVNANVSPAWDAVVTKALAKNRNERYPTAKDFAQAVKDAQAR
jgi:serine/threonine-protein kinase